MYDKSEGNVISKEEILVNRNWVRSDIDFSVVG